MKITTPQIVWHGGENGKNDPVLSADVHPCGVLATGGADAEVRVRILSVLLLYLLSVYAVSGRQKM